jgi:hypothetical protein
LNAAKVTKELPQGLWAECVANDIEHMVVTPNKPKPALNMFYGIQEPKLKIMRTFGVWRNGGGRESRQKKVLFEARK